MMKGQRILVWKKDNFVSAKIVQISANVICCDGTDSKHIHETTHDVELKTGEISKGYLLHGIKEIE